MEDSRAGGREENRRSSNLALAARFVRGHLWLVCLTSLLLLIPCFWHPKIEAGDLGSHVYNAWLANQVERGQAPDLYVAPQVHNVATDVALAFFGKRLGYVAAERAVAGTWVLIFFWGSFAFIGALAGRPPWFLFPALLMVTYGYTFQMGFFNYYLSIGLALLGAALLWQAHLPDWITAGVLGLLAFVAHPVGLLMLVTIAAYLHLAKVTRGWWSVLPFAAALVVVTGVHFYVTRFRVMFWETSRFYLFNGADQVILFGKRYTYLYVGLLALLVVCFVLGLVEERERRRAVLKLMWIPVGLWLVLLFAAAVIPEVIFLPQYPAPLALFVSRSTCLSAVFLLSALALLRPRLWHLAGFSLCGLVFFVWLYQDTGELNSLEAQAEHLMHSLPAGTRFIGTLGPPPGSRILFIEHMLDRACLGYCSTFDNYEPASQQFRIRVRPGSRRNTTSAEDVGLMEVGQYVVKAGDLPLKQIYQCKVNELNRLCIRDLIAGEKNCGDCNNPFYQFMHPSGP